MALLLVLLLAPLSAFADSIPVAIISTNPDSLTRTITFTYAEDSVVKIGGMKFEDGVYPLNDSGRPTWAFRGSPRDTTITAAVFDKSFAKARPKTTFRWFGNMRKLARIEGIENLNTDSVENMAAMFQNCRCLTAIDVSGFNTANVTSMSSMFEGCAALTSLDVSGFNTANVTNMRNMFEGCAALTSLDVSGFNTANVTSMISMFKGCAALTSLDVSGFNTANVTSMSMMFEGCAALTSLDVSGFNTANVTSMSSMFEGCAALTSLDVSGFNTANVTSMDYMFCDCVSLDSLDVSGFDTRNVTRAYLMFDNCSLRKLSLGGNDLSNIEVAEDAFKGIGLYWPCYLVVDSTFDKSVLGDKIDDGVTCVEGYYKWLGGNFSLSQKVSVPLVRYSFRRDSIVFYCEEKDLTHPLALQLETYRLDMVNSYGGYESPSWTYAVDSLGERLTARVTTAVFDKSFAMARPKTTSLWFYGMGKLAAIEGIENLNTDSVRLAEGMFTNCSSLTTLDASHFNLQNIVDNSGSIIGAYSLTTLAVGSNSFSNTDNSYMFSGIGSALRPCYLQTDAGFDVSVLGEKTSYGFYKWHGGCFTLSKTVSLPMAKIAHDDDSNTSTITFLYKADVDVTTTKDGDDSTYYFNGDEGMGAGDFWYTHFGSLDSTITKAVFDPSFAQVRLRSTYCLLGGMTHLVAIEGMENLNTSETTDFGGMFAGCSSLKSIDLSGFDTGKALYMSNMFNGCSSLTDIDVSGFKTDKVETMASMFAGCSSLTDIDVSGFKTDCVRRFNYMFDGCSGLKRLDISNFSFAKAKYAELMLNGCTALTELNVGSLDFSNVTTSNRNGEAFDGVGTADSPCTLKVSGDFATSQLGDRLTNGQGVGYYSWLGGYFTEPVTDTPTAVDKVASDLDVDAPRYNLSGQRVGKGYKGVVVVNGRKLVVK